MSRNQRKDSQRAQVDAATRAMHDAWYPAAGLGISSTAYATYAGRVVSMLAGGADDVEIADYLGEIELGALGSPPGGSRDLLDVARRIRTAVAASLDRAT